MMKVLNMTESYDYLSSYAESLYNALKGVDKDQLYQAYRLLFEAAWHGHPVFVAGNGGSAAIAEHFTCDHSKGVWQGTRLIPNMISLSSNMALITAIANDHGYDEIFSRQLMYNNAGTRDLLVVVSSSGNSPNIVKALEYAHEHAIPSIALVGFTGGKAKDLASVCIHIPVNNYGIVEDAHQAIMHSLAHTLKINNKQADAKELIL